MTQFVLDMEMCSYSRNELTITHVEIIKRIEKLEKRMSNIEKYLKQVKKENGKEGLQDNYRKE